jgi:plasmid stability protein
MTKESLPRVGLSPLEDIDREILNRFLDPQEGVPWEARAILRTKLGLPPEAAAPAATTNAPPVKLSSR